jgi:hypothetical protein
MAAPRKPAMTTPLRKYWQAEVGHPAVRCKDCTPFYRAAEVEAVLKDVIALLRIIATPDLGVTAPPGIEFVKATCTAINKNYDEAQRLLAVLTATPAERGEP